MVVRPGQLVNKLANPLKQQRRGFGRRMVAVYWTAEMSNLNV